MVELYNLLKTTSKISMELVDDIEYHNKFIEGIVIYFEDGTTFQICKDVDNHVSKDNSYMLIDENLGVRLTVNDREKMIHEVIKLIEKRNSEIED